MKNAPTILKAISIAFILSLFIFHFSFSQDSTVCYLKDPEGRIREHNVDFIKMLLNVKFNTKEGKVMGDVKYEFQPIQYIVDTLFLNAPGIDIKKVLLNGKDAQFSVDSNGLTIKFLQAMDWNKKYKLEISYEATPRKGLYFIGWNVNEPNTDNDIYFTRKQIWTQGQGTDNRYWFPSYDDVNDKMLTETIITFDSAYTVISNGVLKDKKLNPDGTFTWHYAMSKPMVPYLVMIAIDKYAHKDYKSKNGITSRQYYYSNRPETAGPTYQYSAEMMDFLSQQTGFPYPWESYANIPVQDFMYGAMENTTATVYGDFLLNDARGSLERPYNAVNAHELTHQWFGDCLTEYSPPHHWLHESFATYYSKQFMRHALGEDAYEWNKRNEAIAAITADKSDRFPIAHSHAGGARVYPKGSFVIDMIRYVVGDSVFKHCITGYVKKHAYSNVTNYDFMMAFMENAGENLDWFFDQWVFHPGEPDYEVKYERKADEVVFYVKQVQKTDEFTSLFKMPLVFEVHFKDGSSSSKKAWLSHASDTVYVSAPAGEEIDYILFDPASNVLKITGFPKSFEELSAQALRAKNMIDRYDAILALRDSAIAQKRDLLLQVYNKGNYNAIQNEIIYQLSKDTSATAIELFKNALRDKDFTTRRAVADNLNDFSTQILPAVEKLLQDSSYITIELTLRKLCRLYPAKAGIYLETTKNVKGLGNNVRIAWLEIKSKTSAADSIKCLKQIVKYASNQYEFRTRTNAIDALGRTGYFDEELAKNLFNAALYTNTRLSNPAAKAIKAFIKTPANLQLAKAVFDAGQWKDWEKKILEELLKV